jgi:hypothetical protein
MEAADTILASSTATEILELNAVYAYKSGKDTKPGYAGTVVSGLVIDSPNTPIIQYDATSSFEFGKGKKSEGYEMKVRSDGTFVYVLFHLTETKELKNKWIKLTPAEYATLTEKSGLEPLFLAFEPEKLSEIIARSKATMDIVNKYNVFEVFPFTIEDNFEVKNATRYNFVYTEGSIRPYITEMLKLRAKYGEVANDDMYKTLNKLIKRDEAVAYMEDMSYLSIWIDNTTSEPVRIVDSFWFSNSTNKKAKPVNLLSDTTFVKLKSPKTVTAPTSTISFTEAAKIMKLKLDKPKK